MAVKFFFSSIVLCWQLECSGMAARPLLADQLESSGIAVLFSKLSTKKEHHKFKKAPFDAFLNL